MDQKSKQKDKDVHADVSKLERLLISHSLEGLVYEKRQRKQAVNAFQQSILSQQAQKKKIPQVNHHKIKDKKLAKFQKKESKKSQKSAKKSQKSNKKAIVVQKVSQKQKIVNNKGQQPRKRGRPRKNIQIQNNQNEKEDQKEKDNQIIQNIQQNNQKYQISQSQQSISDQQQLIKSKSKQKHVKRKKQLTQKQRNKKQDQTNKKQKIINVHTQNSFNRQQIVENQRRIGFQKFTKVIEEKPEGQQFPQSNQSVISPNSHPSSPEPDELPRTHKIARVHSVSELQNSQLLLETQGKAIVKNDIHNSSGKQQQNDEQPSNEEDKLNSGRRRLPLRRKPIAAVKAQDIQNQEDPEDAPSSSEKKRSRRVRKTKDQALKKFVVQSDSGQSYNENCQVGRRRNKFSGKDYQINRIFRKTDKVNLPSVSLDFDITKVVFESFAHKFNHFDLIHCSLPLDMLVKLPKICSLISKGFIFIWAEKGQIQVGYHWLNRMGFDVIDQIMWIKTNELVTQMAINKINNNSELFPNCRSTCLVGYKCSVNQKTEYCTKISNNIIFSPQRPHSFDKPEQIYEIADLMMPGARKLEIGGRQTQLGGWLTMRHREQRVSRCHLCLRRGTSELQLFLRKNKQCVCRECYEWEVKRQHQQSNQPLSGENDEQKKQQKQVEVDTSSLYPLQTIEVSFQQSFKLNCSKCKTKTLQLLTNHKIEQIPQNSQHLFCKNCLTIPQSPQILTLLNLPQTFFASKTKTCSDCGKLMLCKYYFECFSCKGEHLLCSKCMNALAEKHSDSITKNEDNQKQEQDKKDINSHEWKLKVLNEFPEQRTLCFECRQQCTIPYWGCETCQSWYWCGKCKNSKPAQHANHCHYDREHHLHLII